MRTQISYLLPSHLPYLTWQHRLKRIKEEEKHLWMYIHSCECYISGIVRNKNTGFLATAELFKESRYQLTKITT